jgi:hypothetical protein
VCATPGNEQQVAALPPLPVENISVCLFVWVRQAGDSTGEFGCGLHTGILQSHPVEN